MNATSFIQIGFAFIFGLTGVLKLLAPSAMKHTLQAVGIPKPLSAAGAWLVPLLEIAAAALLLWPSTLRAGQLLALALTAGFAYAVIVALGSKQKIRCSCFGQFMEEHLGWGTAVRIAVLLTMNGALTWAGPPAALDSLPAQELILCGLCWIGVVGLYAAASYITRLMMPTRTE
ncbi:hypothetical protein B5M42_002090 [Paenibacillus athensensis]|uniref:Methylamine utilisation protein MauE domain-containing protein n=1 Tax=Paenibacillus athensensis TaxID=1967502 RepID=A0A4Y8QAD5_9BACL|nr:MauE/DoxX family redox-associated membrane protein [Paenibacillus athensensis]MCD1257628.1 hypothetical protein [Paenibacillus athensensis]